MDLIHVWGFLVALAIILYVVSDGTTLGVGILFPSGRNEEERETLMKTIAPVWDANQTWLVFGGGAIFATFPVVYGVLSSALYIPLITFIAGLIFRGVTFEFRAQARQKKGWNRAFFLGSLLATLSQGFVLGGILSEIKVQGSHFAGHPFDWLSPFSILVGFALVAGYVLLGSVYLILKTSETVQARAYRQAFWSGLAVLIFMAAVTLWTPLQFPLVWTLWFEPPRIYFVWAFPLAGLIAGYGLWRSLKSRREFRPLIYAIILFLSGYCGLVTSLYPYAIPRSVTFEQAASQPETLRFTLWGALIVLPVVVGYFLYSHWVFRGKVEKEEFYESSVY
jgi:cytochrome d ubiquinol oxidase subunit II